MKSSSASTMVQLEEFPKVVFYTTYNTFSRTFIVHFFLFYLGDE